MSSIPDTMLSALLGPGDVETFFARRWDARPSYIPGASDKFRALYSVEGDRWIEHALELEAAQVDARGVQHQFRITADQIAARFREGMTICANVAGDPTLAPALARLAHELGLAGAPFAKIYASPDDRGFALHFDAFHVFVCQLAGRKRWRYAAAPAVVAPIYSGKLDGEGVPVWSHPRAGEPITDDQGVAIVAPRREELEEVVLSEGDCLYLPPGTWHEARAIGRSVALSISPPRAPIHQLIAKTLEDHLTLRPAFRRDVFSRDRSAAVPAEVVEAFRERMKELRELLDGFDERTLHRVWRINVSAHAPAGSVEPQTLRIDGVLEVTDELRRYLVAPGSPGGEDEMHFYAGGSEWSLPIAARSFIDRLTERARFSVDEAVGLDPSLRREEALEILEELAAAGLLRKPR